MFLFKLISLVFGLMGLAFLAGSGLAYNNTREFVDRSIITEGTVVEIVPLKNSDLKVFYYPVIRFQTETGEAVQFRSSTGSDVPAYHSGDPVTVLYDPANPQAAEINSFVAVWGGAGLLLILGLGFTGLGFGGFWVFFHGAGGPALRRRTRLAIH